jgi:hypothetical protein
MSPRSTRALQADALFASALQRSDEVNVGEIHQAIAVSLDTFGGAGCVGRVAQEFGEHPESAAARMRWALATLAVLDGQPVPRMRRIGSRRPVRVFPDRPTLLLPMRGGVRGLWQGLAVVCLLVIDVTVLPGEDRI